MKCTDCLYNTVCTQKLDQPIHCVSFIARPGFADFVDSPLKQSTIDATKDAKTGKGKDRFSLLPWKGIRGVLKVMEFGNLKYPVDSWRRRDDGSYKRYFDALQRHLYQHFVEGETIDPESGLPHLHHAACNALFLAEFTADDASTKRINDNL